MKLIPIKYNQHNSELDLNSDFSKMVYDKVQSLYERNGYQEPWVGYFATINNQIVGSCGFKNLPGDEQKVEIAYVTVPEFEGKGYASEMCNQLVQIALKEDSLVVITAQTSKSNLPSHKILQKNHFKQIDAIIDDKYGEIMEWAYTK